ncbi:MAG TPA: GNAT family N-acetyltransferase [Polyangia bacterium]|nr:GNAT family N-acetyltransferase [Polyangia bacterium]
MSIDAPPTLRRAERGDLPQVIALIRGLAEFEKLPGPDDEAAARFTEDACGPSPRFELDVADLRGEIVGYAAWFMTYSTFLARPSLYLEDLYVRPDRRGRGIGAAFLRRLAGVALERGCGRFEWTVLDWNTRAQKFYRSVGARIMTEWQGCRVEGDALERLGRG